MQNFFDPTTLPKNEADVQMDIEIIDKS
jgi:hypothetical protein